MKTSTDDGGAAFPHIKGAVGMSKRDVFAAFALLAIINAGDYLGVDPEDAGKQAIRIANKMIAEINKTCASKQ